MTTLTEPQQRIVAHQHGHARVVAVAGAGKTTTLTHFIAARLRQGVPSRRMLVLMYNRNAKLDFERKLHTLLPQQSCPEIRTFHALGLKIYQRLVQQQDLPPFHEKILSDSEVEAVVWRLLQQIADGPMRQDILSQRKKWVEPAMAFIDLVKAGLQTPEEVFKQQEFPPACTLFIKLFTQYEQWRKQNRRIGYADMLYDPVNAILAEPRLVKQFGGHMQWILVDEYQDINAIQQALLDIVYAGHGQVMVIGDPDQTIYEFRGSKPEFIVSEFDRTMQQVSLYQLPHTFRYGHQLALLANHLITHNTARDDILCQSHSSTANTDIYWQQTDNEAAAVVQLIQQQSARYPLHEIAVINRIWALCAPIELGLLQAGIPYNLHHSYSVLDRSELKIFWMLFELAAGQFTQYAQSQRYEMWLHFLTTPYPKIKHDLLKQVAQKMAGFEQAFGQQLLHCLPDELSAWQKQSLQTRAELLSDIEHIKMPAYQLAYSYVRQTELLQGIVDNSFSAQQADDQTQTIRAFLAFLQEVNLSSEQALSYLQQLKHKKHQQQGVKGVQLVSVHKSKGLEWPVVILPGLNDRYFPYEPEGEFSRATNLESERRLLYVAITRAKEQLHLMLPPAVASKNRPKEERVGISLFQAELQIKTSQTIGQALYQQQAAVELNMAESQSASWLKRYLTQQGSSLELKWQEKSVISTPLAALQSYVKSKYKPTAQGRKIRHKTFGVGTLTFEDEQYWVIQFEQETGPRTFSKKAVQPFIEPV